MCIVQSFSVYKRKTDKRKKDTKWIVAWTTANGQRKAKTAFTDYQASLELARQLARRAALESVGKADPFEQHKKAPIAKHLDDFIKALESARRAPRYILQVKNRILLIINGLGIKRLDDLDPVAVDRYLTDLAQKKKHSGITRNEYITSIKSLTKWAVTFRRMKDDPLSGLKVTERRAIDPAHPRRALSMGEISKLLDAAERRPLLELQTIRIGRHAGKQIANVDPRVKAKALQKGLERRLVYMMAVWTGLRRNEIRQLTWGDIHLETIPGHITLRARTTKSKRADSLPIHPQLADELRGWKPQDAAADDCVVSAVPNMKCLRADLAMAGIANKDGSHRYVDFHSLRVSLSTLLAAHKVSPRAAQALMRHTDPRLTANVYTDEKLLPLAAELHSVPAIPEKQKWRAAPAIDTQVQSLVAGLTPAQKRALLQTLSRAQAG